MARMQPKLVSSSVIKRYAEGNPILTKADIPYEADCIFNAGVAKYNGKYVMLFRNDYGFDGKGAFKGCAIGIAFSDDGIKWDFVPKSLYDQENR